MVPGLTNGSSRSTASTSPTSLTQDSTADASSSPATIRRRSTSSPPLGNQSRDSTNTKTKKDTDPVQGDPVARFARLFEGPHKKSRTWGSVSITGHTRKHFSWIRCGTSFKSGQGNTVSLPGDWGRNPRAVTRKMRTIRWHIFHCG